MKLGVPPPVERVRAFAQRCLWRLAPGETEIMDLTPDACMDNHWADQKSLGKRDRDDADAPESNGQPAPARLLCGSYLEVVKASPTKPKDLYQAALPEGEGASGSRWRRQEDQEGRSGPRPAAERAVWPQAGGEQQRVDSASSTR